MSFCFAGREALLTEAARTLFTVHDGTADGDTLVTAEEADTRHRGRAMCVKSARGTADSRRRAPSCGTTQRSSRPARSRHPAQGATR
jgi:hypothetical protein